MKSLISLDGQWFGHFTYGPEYGEEIHGEKVQFRLFIDHFDSGVFKGRSVDLEGIGANFELAQVNGFLDGNFISFTKQYPHFYALDEDGNSVENVNQPHPALSYEGYYDERTGTFKGEWELRVEIEPSGDGWIEDVCTGTWELSKD